LKFSKSYFDDIRYFDEAYKRYLLVIFILVFFALPWTLNTYFIFILNLIGIYTIMTVGLNILMGYSGQISLGHAAFMAIGAYTSTILTYKAGMPFWFALPASGLVTAVIGSIAGIPALRLKGLYLAIATMSFAFIIDVIIVEWSGLTNGSDGTFVPFASFGTFEFDTDLKKFYLIWVITILMLIAAKNIIRTRIGRAFVAIRDSDIAAETMGIHLAKYKIIAFGISAFYAGISGSLLAHLLGFIGPDNFTLLDSIAYLIMVIVGGGWLHSRLDPGGRLYDDSAGGHQAGQRLPAPGAFGSKRG